MATLIHCGTDMWSYEAPEVYDGTAFWQCQVCQAWMHRFPVGSDRRHLADRYVERHASDLPMDKEIAA